MDTLPIQELKRQLSYHCTMQKRDAEKYEKVRSERSEKIAKLEAALTVIDANA